MHHGSPVYLFHLDIEPTKSFCGLRQWYCIFFRLDFGNLCHKNEENYNSFARYFYLQEFQHGEQAVHLELPVLQSKSWPAIISKMLKIKKYFGTVFDYETLQNICECVFWDWSFPALAWSFQLIPFSKKTNPKITILEILVYKVQPELIKLISLSIPSLVQSHVHKNMWTWLCSKVEMCEDFKFYYLWLYFIYHNFQNGYFQTSLFTIFFEVICGKWILIPFNILCLLETGRIIDASSDLYYFLDISG